MLPMKQTVENYQSRHLNGALMYPGKYLCTHILLWGSVWVQIACEPIEPPAAR